MLHDHAGWLRELNQVKVTCWTCKVEENQELMVSVTDGNTIWMELCPNCYDFYVQQKRT